MGAGKTLRLGLLVCCLSAALVLPLAGGAPAEVGPPAVGSASPGTILFTCLPASRLGGAKSCGRADLNVGGIMRGDGSRVRRIGGPKLGFVVQASFSPDGRRIAAATRNNALTVLDRNGRNRRTLVSASRDQLAGPSEGFSWSPDGSEIYYLKASRSGISEIVAVDTRGRGSRTFFKFCFGDLDPPCAKPFLGLPIWAPGGRRVAASSSLRDATPEDPNDLDFEGVWLLDPGGNAQPLFERRQRDKNFLGLGDPAWSPDGKTLALFASRSDGTTQILLIDVATGTATVRLDGLTTKNLEELKWSADGRWLAYMGIVGRRVGLFTLRVSGGAPKHLSRIDDIGTYAWSPTGARVAFTIDNSEIWAFQADGTQRKRLIANPRIICYRRPCARPTPRQLEAARETRFVQDWSQR